MNGIYQEDDPLLDRNDLKKRFPLLPNSPSQLRRLEANGFPPAVWISERRRAWRLSSVKAYLEKREAEATERAAKRAAKVGV